VSKGAYDSWDTPTISTVGGSFNTATTSHTDTSAASFTTHSNGFLIIGSCFNDNVTSSASAVTQSGATFGTVSERCDGGTATGNDVSGKVHTCSVTTGASATITQTQTISAASQGEALFVEQTVTFTPPAWPYFQNAGSSVAAVAATATPGVPTGTTTDDVLLAFLWIDGTGAVTPPSGFTEDTDSPITPEGTQRVRIFWKRQTSATGSGETTGTYTFTPSASTYVHAIVGRYSGCITSGNPISANTNGALSGNASTPSTSLSSVNANELFVWMAYGAIGWTLTVPGFFSGKDIANQEGVDNPVIVCSKGQASAGSTGTLTGTWSGATDTAVWLGALTPPAEAEPPPVIPGRTVGDIPNYRSNLY
jgi:hypothetical protein